LHFSNDIYKISPKILLVLVSHISHKGENLTRNADGELKVVNREDEGMFVV
jgi:hypothetical protein